MMDDIFGQDDSDNAQSNVLVASNKINMGKVTTKKVTKTVTQESLKLSKLKSSTTLVSLNAIEKNIETSSEYSYVTDSSKSYVPYDDQENDEVSECFVFYNFT
jgi:hypothetical protein